MLASRLIEILQEAMREVGDLHVFSEADWEWVTGIQMELDRPFFPAPVGGGETVEWPLGMPDAIVLIGGAVNQDHGFLDGKEEGSHV